MRLRRISASWSSPFFFRAAVRTFSASPARFSDKVCFNQLRPQIEIRRVGGGQFLEFGDSLVALAGLKKKFRMDGLILPVGKGRSLPVSLLGLIGLPRLHLHGAKIHERRSMFRVDGQRLAELLFRLRRSAVGQVEFAQIDSGVR